MHKGTFYSLAAAPFLFFACGYLAASWWFGSTKVLVPSVLGVSVAQALELAGQQEVGLMIKDFRIDDTLPSGTVVEQLPRPGYSLPAHQPLMVTVSRRTAAPVMPDVVGQQVQVVKDFATKYGLPVAQGIVPSDAPQGSCLQQWPLPGAMVTNGAVAACIAGPKPSWQIMPALVGKSVEDVCQALAQQQLATSVVHVYPQAAGHSCATCTVTGQRPLPGTVLDGTRPLIIYLLVS